MPIHKKILYLDKCIAEYEGLWRKVDGLGHGRPFRHEILVRWTPPPEAPIKINTDSAFKGNLGLSSAGCVLRDHWRS